MNEILTKQSIKQIRQDLNNKPLKINNYTLTDDDKQIIKDHFESLNLVMHYNLPLKY